MKHDFHQTLWDDQVEGDCRQLVRLARHEDLADQEDWTTNALVDRSEQSQVVVSAHEPGVISGLRAAEIVLCEMGPAIQWQAQLADGDQAKAGAALATMRGPVRELLTCERILLNFLGRLSGIATQTRRFADCLCGASAAIYDTRKTTPGWRRLEKYAVRCGGGRNHRTGLFDAVLIKDNHLASGASGSRRFSPGEAVNHARAYLAANSAADPPKASSPSSKSGATKLVEIEVDTLQQLEGVLPAGPDIVLLDNMSLEDLGKAVALRDRLAPEVELDASGGVTFETLPKIAATGVERISIGALTHQAVWLDIGLDWAG